MSATKATVTIIESSYIVDTKLAPGYANRKRKLPKQALVVPPSKPIKVGDTVAAKPYQTGIGEGRQFNGMAKVVWITTEQRRSFSDGTLRDYQRVTVITSDGKRKDILVTGLMLVLSAQEVAPVAKPAPMPETVQVIDLYPLLLCAPQIAGYLPARTKDNERTVFAIEAQLARQRVRGTSDLPPVDIGKRGQWVKIDGEVVKVRMG